MCAWVLGRGNKNKTGYAGSVGGVPSDLPKWQLLQCAKYGVAWEVCADNEKLFLSSAELVGVALDISTGKKVWENVFPEEAGDGIAVDHNHVYIAPYVLDAKSGEIVDEMSCSGCSSFYVEDVFNGGVVVSAERDGEEKDELLIIYRDGCASYLNMAMTGVTSTDDAKRVIGLSGNHLLCASTIDGQVAWSTKIPVATNGEPMVCGSAYMVVGDAVYLHCNFDTIRCLDLLDGSLRWQSGPNEIEDNETRFACRPPWVFIGYMDALYLGRDIDDDGFIQARSTEDGRELWRIDAPQARLFLIAGDLLFGALDDLPVAWDRHTGELVWQAAKRMTAIFHAVAADNKVIYNNTMSQMRCYEWQEPYCSPARTDRRGSEE